MGCQNKSVFNPIEANIKALQMAQADQMYKIKRGLKWCDECMGYHVEIIKSKQLSAKGA